MLDVDVKPDGSGFAAFNRLKDAGLLTGAGALVRTRPAACTSTTRAPASRAGGLPRHFLDFKAAGGYVLAPPSVVGGKPYELLDRREAAGPLDWQAARRLLDPPRPRHPPGQPAGAGPADALVAWVASAHRRQPEQRPVLGRVPPRRGGPPRRR